MKHLLHKLAMSAFVVVILTQLTATKTFAQGEPPTLSFGLDDVLFKKGIIDVDLLTKIITEKQSELKGRIVENEILAPIYANSPFVTKNFVYSIVKQLMNEKDKNVIKKELMEHTANYALVYLIAEMYTQLSWDDLRALDSTGKSVYLNHIFEINPTLITSNNLKLNVSSISLFNSNDYPRLKLTLTDSLCFEYKNHVKNSKEKELQSNFNKVLLDMVFHALRNNEVFISKGFVNKPLSFDLDDYRLQSYYQTLSNNDLKFYMYNDVKSFVNEIAEYYQGFENMYKIMQDEEISTKEDFLANYNLKLKKYKEIITKDATIKSIDTTITGVRNSDSLEISKFNHLLTSKDDKLYNLEDLKKVFSDTNNVSFAMYINTVKKAISDTLANSDHTISIPNDALNDVTANVIIDTLMNKIDRQLKTLALKNLGSNVNIEDSVLYSLIQTFYDIRYNRAQIKNMYFVNSTRTKLLPKLALLNFKYGGHLSEIIDNTELLLSVVEVYVNKPIYDRLNRNTATNQFLTLIANKDNLSNIYLEFFKRFDDLDKVETYYYLLQNLLAAGSQSKSRDVSNSLNLILQSIEKYTMYDNKNDFIDIDVESIILALHNKYGSRDKNPFNFYFTLGLNTAFAFNNNSLIDSDNNPITNFGYASEKIGLRINLINWKLKNSYSYMETKPRNIIRWCTRQNTDIGSFYKKEPVISNLHFLFYGSGLLYQLTELSTAKNLNTSFIGSGFGITFFNNLNFNASLMLPLKPRVQTSFDKVVLNVGFDIYFSEYISELNKKRKENKDAEMKMELEKYKASFPELKPAKN